MNVQTPVFTGSNLSAEKSFIAFSKSLMIKNRFISYFVYSVESVFTIYSKKKSQEVVLKRVNNLSN